MTPGRIIDAQTKSSKFAFGAKAYGIRRPRYGGALPRRALPLQRPEWL